MKRIVAIIVVFLLTALIPVQGVLAAEASVGSVMLTQGQQSGAAGLTLYVGLRDESGKPVTGNFSPDQFAISLDGHTLPVESLEAYDPATQGIHYVFAVDVSGSLNDDMAKSMIEAMTSFVERMGPLDVVSIITFGETVQQLLDRCGDVETIKSVIAGIAHSDQYTALYEGVLSAAVAASGDRSAVIVITDGWNTVPDGAESPSKDDIFAQLKKARMPLYCIGMNDNVDYGGVDADSLNELADTTDGEAFIGSASQIGEYIDEIYAINCGTIELHTTMANYDGKTSFSEPSSVMVGYRYQSDSEFFISNELQMYINWGSVPAPAAAVTPTPVPQISLELDTNSEAVMYEAGKKTVLTGLIEVEQGSFEQDDVTITVNDEAWRTTLLRNGSNYTFSAEGLIGAGVSTLNVRAVISTDGGDLSSRVVTAEVLAPTATPAPVIAVELDDLGKDILFESGKTVTISGIINVQGEASPNGMELFVNGAQNEITVNALQPGQYEFTADVVLPEQAISELKVQIVLKDANVRSHAQTIPLVAPTAEPDPELRLTINGETVEYTGGQPLTLRGNIEVVSGQVDEEDLALYVNSARWGMTLTAQGDGTYSFEAAPENELVGDLTKLDVRVRLASNTKVSSELITIAVATPEPEATATPSPRPEVTPPPTTAPTKAPASTQTETEPEPADNSLYYYIAGGVLLLIIIILVVVIALRKKKQPEQEVVPVDFTTVHDSGENVEGTVRADAESDEGSTIIDGTVQSGGSGDDFVDDDGGSSSAARGGRAPHGTVSLDGAMDGTVRLDEDAEQGGTVRLEERWELTVTVDAAGKSGRDQHTLRLTDDGQQVVFGRSDTADVVIGDTAVSGRHLAASFDGEGLYITDLGSTNGTKVNNVAIAAHEPCRLASGDHVRIGQTTLEFTFGEPELW